MKAVVLPILKTRSRPRERRQRRVTDKAHLGFVASLQCCVPFCQAAPVHVHHLRCHGAGASAGKKSGDDKTVPLCGAWHHQGDLGVHKIGEEAFWSIHGIDPLALAAKLWAASHGSEMP